MAIKTYFQNIADAIRAKGGTVATLTPSEMPQAIADLPTGGGLEPLTAYVRNDRHHYCYGSGVNYTAGVSSNHSDIYNIEYNEELKIYVYIPNPNAERINPKASMINTDPTQSTSYIAGEQLFSFSNRTNPAGSGYFFYFPGQTKHQYLVVTYSDLATIQPINTEVYIIP
jgi:hypothetical protein